MLPYPITHLVGRLWKYHFLCLILTTGPFYLQVEREVQEVVEGKVEERSGGELEDAEHQVEKVVEVGGAGEEEKERRVIIEIIEDANNILKEESEEEDFKGEDSENIDKP